MASAVKTESNAGRPRSVRPLRVVVVTQEDSVAIPRNIQRVLEMDGVEVALIASLKVRGALENRKLIFARGFGLWQTSKMAAKLLTAKLANLPDAVCGYRLLRHKRSVKAVAAAASVPYVETSAPNGDEFLDQLRQIEPDLIVSFSAPCVFGEQLLAIPRRGCINLHCSRLPSYAGLLPSFWVLYHQEATTGATVHYMDCEIDNGDILNQAEVAIEPGMSMLDLIVKTKRVGGDLMVKTIAGVLDGSVSPVRNNRQDGSYFSWPTIEQMREFRQRGGRFV